MGFTRLAGLGALGFVAIIVGLNAVLESTEPPAGDASAAEVARYFTEHADLVRTGVVLAAVAWVCVTIFGAGAIERQGRDTWSMVGLVGIVMQSVLFAAVCAARLALTLGGGDATISLLWHLHNGFWALNGIGLVITLMGFSFGGLRTATLRPWHAAVGLTSAALLLAGTVFGVYDPAGGGPASLSAIGLVGWVLWVVWLAAFGTVLLRAKRQGATPAPVGLPVAARGARHSSNNPVESRT